MEREGGPERLVIVAEESTGAITLRECGRLLRRQKSAQGVEKHVESMMPCCKKEWMGPV